MNTGSSLPRGVLLPSYCTFVSDSLYIVHHTYVHYSNMTEYRKFHIFGKLYCLGGLLVLVTSFSLFAWVGAASKPVTFDVSTPIALNVKGNYNA
ncbi:hypothetical protein PALA111701_30145 [Paenibacillus lactis]